jgi:hypothetical protein
MGARGILWEGSSGGSFLVFWWGRSHRNVSWDEAFPRRLFGDVNHDVLGPPGDGKIIILSNSDEKEEVHKEMVIDVEAAPCSVLRSPASTTSTDVGDAPSKAKNDNSNDRTPDQEADNINDGKDDVVLP